MNRDTADQARTPNATGYIAEDFVARSPDAPLSAHWKRTLAGVGQLRLSDEGLRLVLDGAEATRYSDAQLDDYSGLRASRYPWRPPLRMRVRARASHATQPVRRVGRAEGNPAQEGGQWLRGTAGFGFWNAPFTLAGGGVRPPEALWFFAASAPSRLALTDGGAAYGWKAQMVHSRRLGALAATPPMALSAIWARISGDDRAATHWMERLSGAHEATLDSQRADLRQWHDYSLEWQPDIARFAIDDQIVLAAPHPPRGPLGFVAWIDNQYAIVTPRGKLRFGALTCPPQWLELASLVIEPLT